VAVSCNQRSRPPTPPIASSFSTLKEPHSPAAPILPLPEPFAAASQTAPTNPMENSVRTLQIVRGSAFPVSPVLHRTLPVSGVRFTFADGPMLGSRVVCAVAGAASPYNYRLVDAESGVVIQSFADFYGTFATLGASIVARTINGPQALLFWKPGKIVTPRITLPNAERPRSWRIVVASDRPLAWLVVRSHSGAVYHGPWSNPTEPEVQISEPLDFWPSAMSGDDGIHVASREEDCYLDPGARQGCVRERRQEGIVVDGVFVPAPRELLHAGFCPPHMLTVGDQPDTWQLWGRDTSGKWSGLPVPHDPAVPPPGARVHWLGRLVGAIETWIDFASRTVYATEPLVPLFPEPAEYRRVLVQPPKRPSELWLLDFVRGTQSLIADDYDCDSSLHWLAMSSTRAIVACTKPSMVGQEFSGTNRRLGHYAYTDVIDFPAQLRYRSYRVFEADLTTSGLAVGVLPGKVNQLAVLSLPKAETSEEVDVCPTFQQFLTAP